MFTLIKRSGPYNGVFLFSHMSPNFLLLLLAVYETIVHPPTNAILPNLASLLQQYAVCLYCVQIHAAACRHQLIINH